MSVSGLCDICENATAVARCERCGSVVCKEHHAAELGYCTDCARAVRQSDGTGDQREGDTFTF